MVDAWADAADVLRWTAQSVTDDDVSRAQDIVELNCGTTYLATANISPKNLRHLNRAVAYQAGWAKLNPDLYTSRDVESAGADGQNYQPGHESAHLIAPLARRHIRQLSWVQRPLRVRRRYGQPDYLSDGGNRDSASRDDARYWTPL